MDFLKTLMIYMSMLFLMGVENAEMPDPSAMPTPTPAAVETTAAPVQAQKTNGPVAIATPAVSAKPAAPTMTPNARYGKLKMGDKNNQVKKLQQKLIQLGYLKKGSDDGAYGYQTYNAIREFQKANGLAVDGIAGKATQTFLFENKEAVAKPTATAKPKATPAAKATAAAQEAKPAEEDKAEIAGWYKTNAKVLLNGSPVVLLKRGEQVVTEAAPAVYLHDGHVMVSLTELAKASGEWKLESNKNSCVLSAAGYTVTIERAGNGYAVSSDGKKVEVSGDAVFLAEDNSWYVETVCLEKALAADVVWDSEENTLVIRVVDKAMAESED